MRKQKDVILSEAINDIRNQLAARAISVGGKSYWETKTGHKSSSQWVASPSIYGGVAGIVLFFIELYRMSNSPSDLDYARRGAKWLVDYLSGQKELFHGSFFTGNLGVCFVLLKLSEVTRDPFFEKSAKKFITSFKRYDSPVDDLLNGNSGIVIGLLHLHSLLKDDSFLHDIDYYLSKILGNAFLSNNGVYWDRSVNSISGLCGLSHGAAGMGYTFLEVGRYFVNPAYFALAADAFAYENSHYDIDSDSWPDLRKMNLDEDTEENFRQNFFANNLDFFEQGTDFTAWCHGANGIALSRLLALECLARDSFRSDLEKAVKKVLRNKEYTTYTLCHGFGGDVLLLLELYKYTGEREYYERASQIVFDGISLKNRINRYVDGCAFKDGKDDLSLFNGLAGIGYYMLCFLSPSKVYNILFPRVRGIAYPKDIASGRFEFVSIAYNDLKQKILQRYVPVALKGGQFDEHFLTNTELVAAVSKVGELDLMKNYEQEIEFSKLTLETSIKSWAYFAYLHRHFRKAVASILENEYGLQSLQLVLSKYVLLVRGSQLNSDMEKYALVYIDKPSLRSTHLEISEFEFDVLGSFKKPASVGEVFNQIQRNYEADSDSNPSELRDLFDNTIANAVSALALFRLLQ